MHTCKEKQLDQKTRQCQQLHLERLRVVWVVGVAAAEVALLLMYFARLFDTSSNILSTDEIYARLTELEAWTKSRLVYCSVMTFGYAVF